MAHVALRYRFKKIATTWEYDVYPELQGVATGKVDIMAPMTKLDGWACRDEFFKLPKTSEAYLKFLNKVGLWFPEETTVKGIAVGPAWSHMWEFREELKQSLVSPKRFLERWGTRLGVRFELEANLPVAVIETTCLHQLLIATISADLINGTRFQFCQRRDCGIPFAVATAHKRKFCSQACGHLVSVRNLRKKLKKQRRKEEQINGSSKKK